MPSRPAIDTAYWQVGYERADTYPIDGDVSPSGYSKVEHVDVGNQLWIVFENAPLRMSDPQILLSRGALGREFIAQSIDLWKSLINREL